MYEINTPDNKADDYYELKYKQIAKGKRVVTVFIGINIVRLVLSQLIALYFERFGLANVVHIFVWGIILTKLYSGRAWAKWWYIIGSIFSLIISILLLVVAPNSSVFFDYIWLFSGTVLDIVFSCILIFSLNVKEFLNSQWYE